MPILRKKTGNGCIKLKPGLQKACSLRAPLACWLFFPMCLWGRTGVHFIPSCPYTAGQRGWLLVSMGFQFCPQKGTAFLGSFGLFPGKASCSAVSIGTHLEGEAPLLAVSLHHEQYQPRIIKSPTLGKAQESLRDAEMAFGIAFARGYACEFFGESLCLLASRNFFSMI